MTSIALSSRGPDPSGGIWDEGRLERIRTSIALVCGDAGSIVTLAPSGCPGTCSSAARGRLALELACAVTLSGKP